jgi:hypothetical protein
MKVAWSDVVRGSWMIVSEDAHPVRILRRLLHVIETQEGCFWHWEGSMHLFPLTQPPDCVNHCIKVL